MPTAVITTVRETTWDISFSDTFTDTFTLSNLGPLITTYTPPPACLNTWYVTSFHLELGVESETACFPPGFTPGSYRTSGYYSPGLCPSSYTGATSLGLWWTSAGESGLHCCPIGYWLPAALTGSCFTPLSSTLTTSFTDEGVVRVGEFSEIWAPAIPVLWKSLAEFSAATTASTAASTSLPSPGSTRSAPRPTAAQPRPVFKNHTATIILATVIPLVLIALAIAAWIVLRWRARRIPADMIPELPGNEHGVHKVAPVELAAVSPAAEMPTTEMQPVELPAVDSPDGGR